MPVPSLKSKGTSLFAAYSPPFPGLGIETTERFQDLPKAVSIVYTSEGSQQSLPDYCSPRQISHGPPRQPHEYLVSPFLWPTHTRRLDG